MKESLSGQGETGKTRFRHATVLSRDSQYIFWDLGDSSEYVGPIAVTILRPARIPQGPIESTDRPTEGTVSEDVDLNPTS